MYQVLRDSRVTLNHHIGIAANYANNMRLFEATGVGTMLLTDKKQNLHDMFEPGKELVVYNSADECLEIMRYFLDHDDERESIARAGQRRTLRDHNYGIRMQELVELVA
jgi:spore maturation protein CgeB